MRYASFPRSGELVSKLGFGAMGFAGWFGAGDEAEWIQAMLHALDRGVSFVDTARAYGGAGRLNRRGLRPAPRPCPLFATEKRAPRPPLRCAMPVVADTGL